MLFHEIITDIDEQGKPMGGFLIPNNVPIEDVKAMFKAGKIEIIYLDEADLDFITGASVGPVLGFVGKVKDANTATE